MAKIDIQSDRLREFLAEAEDILNSMGKDLLKLGKGVKAGIIDPAVLNSIFRSAHTLKGMSGIFDFTDMFSLSHSLEDTLDLLRLGRTVLTDEVLDNVMAAHELLVRIVASKGTANFTDEIERLKNSLGKSHRVKKARSGEQIDKEVLSALTEYEEHRFRECLREGKNLFIVNVRFPITSFDKGYAALIEALKNHSEVIATLPSAKTSHETLFFDILIGTKNDRAFISNFLRDIAEVEIRVIAEPSSRGAAHDQMKSEPSLEVITGHGRQHGKETLRRVSNTVRVNIGKLDNIMNIVSELGILKTSIASLSAELKSSSEFSVYGLELSRSEKSLERKLAELRESVLDVRMVPIGQLFGRFDTFTNKLSRESGKETRMVTYGDETELDKLIVEELSDPLMHIIRNVIDHAIEAPAVREALGKPRAGAITLSAYQKGNHVVIEVKDDGAGMDADFIRGKAVEKGIVTREYAAGLTRQEAFELIFMPGFSTRDTVSETSGRGVGMDVVKENITRLSGIIDIETVQGKGTRFMLTIPITLAIIQALIVEDSGKRYAVPLNAVIEIIDLRSPEERSGDMESIKVHNREIPSVRLSRYFGKKSSARDVCYGIVAGLAEHRLCVIVDSLVEELDVVIKPLPRILKVPGIAGATDMGEKGTILVLDITGILDQVLKERKTGPPERPSSAPDQNDEKTKAEQLT
ncbi:MAG: chemotaxis protein CheA [Deltaproteobacteria bacterium]|nr:chemotaxis protein CheA [Deltaproteobacteria bacterium]